MLDLDFEDLDKFLSSHKNKIIHQIWFGTIPNKKEARKAYDKLKLYRNSWIINNPSWFRMEWNKKQCEQLIKLCYSEHFETYKNYKYEIQRCDFVRYLILHRYGGWYADMDYYCCKPIDEAMKQFQNEIFFVQTPNGYFGDIDHISNSLMYSISNHPFWKQLLIVLERERSVPLFYTKHLEVMFTTGPGILNRIYLKYKDAYKVKSLPWKQFHPFGILDDKLSLKTDENIFTIHIGKGSWESKDSKFLIFLATNWFIIIFIFVIMMIPFFFYLTTKKSLPKSS